MKNRLLWKLLVTNIIPVILVIFLIIWLVIDELAANYFMALMKEYDVSPDEIHDMFLSSIHYYLFWAACASLILAVVLSYLLIRRILKPLHQMTSITREVASGNFSPRTDVTTSDEVGQLGLAFNKMADSLEQIEQLRKKMVADVAHELRTPLTNLRGYLEALNDGVIPPSSETFKMLQEENLRLVHLVEDLQQLARADAARSFLKKERIDLLSLVHQASIFHMVNFREKNITFSIFPEQGVFEVDGDRDKLLQALRNLLENCWKYTPEAGDVSVRLAHTQKGVKVELTNSGPGISVKDLPYIFERFYRVEQSRSRDVGGAGIGLAITKELVEAHGGRTGAESKPGETSIWFTLPGKG